MPKDFQFMELSPRATGFCLLCGIGWTPKDDPKDELPDHKRFGLWEVCGDQAINKGARKKAVKICNDCLTLLRLASQDITAFHVVWLRLEKETADENKVHPRISPIGMSVLVAMEEEIPKGRGGEKVVCNMSKTCNMGDCGGKTPHYAQDCDPCPRDKEARCVPVEEEG